ncbi:MAG: hypothetical protein BMS9Abin09_0872 [Gammaproteobacteria bacterium]|nr:MAG: hypothetical protein BMS9Abin09_0872 [Gammaproteobacteria bacterium]
MLLQTVFKQARNYGLFEIGWVVADKWPGKFTIRQLWVYLSCRRMPVSSVFNALDTGMRRYDRKVINLIIPIR